MPHEYLRLGDQPQRLTKDTTLLHNEKCIIAATAGTIVLPILVDNVTSGQLFMGKGQLTLGTIIETTRGAIGKPLIRDLTSDHPFLMLAETNSLKENLAPATDKDILSMGYTGTDEFLETAHEAFDQFAHRRRNHIDIQRNAQVFAFANEQKKWDFLVAKDGKLVYTSKQKVYISKNSGESISLGQGSILVAKKGKTVVIDKGNILVDRD